MCPLRGREGKHHIIAHEVSKHHTAAGGTSLRRKAQHHIIFAADGTSSAFARVHTHTKGVHFAHPFQKTASPWRTPDKEVFHQQKGVALKE